MPLQRLHTPPNERLRFHPNIQNARSLQKELERVKAVNQGLRLWRRGEAERVKNLQMVS
jgi:hypothetical protein